MSDKPEWYTADELAETFRVSKMTIFRMIHAGDIRALRMGSRAYRIPASELDRMLKEARGEDRPPRP